jgi:hypothetical protein
MRIQPGQPARNFTTEEEKMNDKQEKAAFICTKDTLDGAYPSLVLGINAVRMGMETKVFYSFMGLNWSPVI